MESNSFQSNFGARKNTSQNIQLLTQCLKILSKYIPELAQDVVYLYFDFQIKKLILILIKSPFEFLFSFALNYKYWKSILLVCSVKKGVLENRCL